MPYVVHWISRGPDMSAACETVADLIELTEELAGSGRMLEIRVTQGEQEIDLDELKALAPRRAAS